MKIIKNLSLIMLCALVLSGCAPKIVAKYDEFKNEKKWKLEPFLIRFNKGFFSSRHTTIGFTKWEKDKKIKGVITSHTTGDYSPLSPNAEIRFTIDPDKLKETISTNGYDYTIKSGYESRNTMYCMVSIPTTDSSVFFDVTQDQLKRIASSKKVSFYFQAGKEPVEGELTNSEKKIFLELLKKK